jgi:uncharacterized protein (TIGR02300 family)
VAKPEWGTKRICQSCATKFYDLGRSPITCPQCGAQFDPEALLKSRRGRSSPEIKAPKPEVAKKEPDKEEADLDASEDESLIEDTSDLGEGDEDMADVVVGADDEED